MKREIKLVAICIFSIFTLLSSLELHAQDDYKYEVGGMLGMSFYMGDANKTKLYKDVGVAGGALFRYKMDLDWALKSNLVLGRVSGDTRKSGDAFPFAEQIEFNRTFIEMGTQIEYNFFSFSDEFAYLGAKRITPYVFTGIGVTYATGDKSFFNAHIPVGIGMKYKLKKRWNIGLEFSFRKLFGDSFDVTSQKPNDLNLDAPYKINSSFFKNKDWYSLTMLTISWDFGLRECPCLNID